MLKRTMHISFDNVKLGEKHWSKRFSDDVYATVVRLSVSQPYVYVCTLFSVYTNNKYLKSQ